MKRQQFTTRFANAVVSGLIGAVCGGMLTSFGHLVSSSTLTVGATIVSGAVLGAWLGRFWGAMNGAMLGGLATAVGGLVAGSLIGVLCTIGACGLLGGWLRWCSQERGNDRVTPRQTPSVDHQASQLQFACFVEQDNSWIGTQAATSLGELRWNCKPWSTIRL